MQAGHTRAKCFALCRGPHRLFLARTPECRDSDVVEFTDHRPEEQSSQTSSHLGTKIIVILAYRCYFHDTSEGKMMASYWPNLHAFVLWLRSNQRVRLKASVAPAHMRVSAEAVVCEPAHTRSIHSQRQTTRFAGLPTATIDYDRQASIGQRATLRPEGERTPRRPPLSGGGLAATSKPVSR